MKNSLIAAIMLAAAVLAGCKEQTPTAKHVIFLGFDAQGSYGIQRSVTPNFNYMIENGAVSLDTRSVRSTSSSQNWMSMVTGAPIEVHGVYDNSWEIDNQPFEPGTARNAKNLFPAMWDNLRAQKPASKIYSYIEWAGETRMYDMDAFDKAVYNGDGTGKEYTADDLLEMAFADYIADEPELMFVSIDIPDHAGHSYGHESQGYFDCIHHMDEMVGKFVKDLEARDMLKDAVIFIVADHGGILYGHGGDTLNEMQVPVIMYGKGVTKGKVMEHTNMIYDEAATVCGLLGVEMPRECRGKFLYEAFEPKTDVCYVPMPLATPFKGVVKPGEKVTLSCDIDGAEIYYTLDGTTPTKESIKYDGPFEITESCTLQSVGYKNGTYSVIATNFLQGVSADNDPCVSYKLYKGWTSEVLPDFTKFGRADAVGDIHMIGLDELPMEPTWDDFAVIFHTTLVIKEDGKYKFELASDDGSKLYIDNQLVIDNDGSHSMTSRLGTIDLKAGDHAVCVEYFDDCDGQQLELRFNTADKTPRPLATSDLKK